MISTAIQQLVNYGLDTGLILPDDEIYIRNQLLMTMQLDSFAEPEGDVCYTDLESILKTLVDDAVARGVCEDNSTARDLFDTRLMGVLTPRPSIVRANFEERYESEGPQAATDWFYEFSQDTNYIRRDRVKKDMKWKVNSPYGDIDITINLSKPEKDPKAIAAAKNAKQSSYPKCQLCMENEGYAGRLDHPARENHRIIPIEIAGGKWGFQYSPYVYYNEHCIVFNGQHIPMKIDKKAFEKLFDFVKLFPHYFLGSNADLPIVGGSILSHDHFQGGHYTFAMAKAPIEIKITIPGYEDVEAGIVKWPLSVIRIRHKDEKRLIDLADHILRCWRNYTDEDAFIYANTDGEPHNTITPIARKRDGLFELDLTLRNNITTEENPLGVYHPHAEYHHIKKENIGLIEVMGLAVLPARLKEELELLEQMRPGLVQLEIGVQSTNPKTIKEIHRVMDFEKVSKIVRRIQDKGNVHEHLDLIAGLPYEDVESFAHSFDDVYALKPEQLQLGFLKVLKGSFMQEHQEEYGIVHKAHPPYEVLYTKWISYEDVLRLKGIEEMVEVYYNSRQFTNTMEELEKEYDSAFNMYDRLASYYEDNGYNAVQHKRSARYEILLNYIRLHHKEKEDLFREVLTYDYYLRENAKSRPEFAGDYLVEKNVARAFYEKEEETHMYLPDYGKYDRNQMRKMTHLEYFKLADTYILFDYQNRNPLNQEARVCKVEIDKVRIK